MNLLFCFCILIISIITLYLFKRLLGKLGIKIVFFTMSIISLLLSFKYITLSNISFNSNAITYITMLTSLYLLLEDKNASDVHQTINLNFIITAFASLMLYIMSYYTQTLTDTISVNMTNVFIDNYRILINYPLVTLLVNYVIVAVYPKIKGLYDNKFISTVTTFLLVGLIEGIIYTFLSYYQILSIKTIIELILSTYMIKLIVTVIYSLVLMAFFPKDVVK